MEDHDLTGYPDAELETMLAGEHTGAPLRGAARAELLRRQRKYELERDERQLRPAKASANATVWAGIAAGLSAVAAIVSALTGYLSYHDQHQQQVASATPLINFYTEDSVTQPVVGVQVQNEGLFPVRVSKVQYFVDGRGVNSDLVVNLGKFKSPEKIQNIDFERGDDMAPGEKVWLLYRPTTDKTELDAFTDYVDDHVNIGITACSQLGACVSRCSTSGKCGPTFRD